MDVVRSLVSAVDALCAADPSTLADGESLVALHRELERLTGGADPGDGRLRRRRVVGGRRGPFVVGVAGGPLRAAAGHRPAAGAPGP